MKKGQRNTDLGKNHTHLLHLLFFGLNNPISVRYSSRFLTNSAEMSVFLQ